VLDPSCDALRDALNALGVAVVFAVACTAPVAGPGGPNPVVAEVDGQSITLAELDREIGAELYEVRAQALEELIEKRALARAADRRGLSVDALVDEKLAAFDAIGEGDVAAFFERNVDRVPVGETLETLGPRIRELLEDEQRRAAIDELLEGVDVAVYLPPPRVAVAAVGPARGAADATVTLVEWSDYQCPYCASVEPVLEELLALYPNDVRLVLRHLPLGFHEYALPAAIAAVCAEEQGRFWDYHAALFAQQREFAAESFARLADELALDRVAFDACVAGPEAASRVERDVLDATAAGATGTPAFNLNGIQWSGARRLEAFIELVERELQLEPRTSGDQPPGA
jgi:protein-disulfide isomerase